MTVTDKTDLRDLFEQAGTALDVDTGRLRGGLDAALDRPGSGTRSGTRSGTGSTRARDARARGPRYLTGVAAAGVALLTVAGGVAVFRSGPPGDPSAASRPAAVPAPAGGGGTDAVPGLSVPPPTTRASEVAPHVLPVTPTLPAAQRSIDNVETASVPGQDVVHVEGLLTPVLAYDNGYRERIWALAPASWESGQKGVCRIKVVSGVDVDDPGMWDQSILCMPAPRAGRLTTSGKGSVLYEDFDSIPAERGRTTALAVVSARAKACTVEGGGTTVPLDHRVPVAGTDYAFVYGLVDPDERGLLRLSCTT
ncbi:hypothetical protein [Intrasporangium sp. YIM S08009]|uniref:hypothetical protein n=1 Tax=Intrasporangium zincisolvens TaxID=3080018 RepID=UPI002B060B7C|nr:hypothetical protein [Intrasporangium sp. YIM S08009]